MIKAQVSEVRDNLADVINRTAYGKERVIIERRGKPLAALVSIEDIELLEKIEDQLDILDALTALEEAGTDGAVSWNKLQKTLD